MKKLFMLGVASVLLHVASPAQAGSMVMRFGIGVQSCHDAMSLPGDIGVTAVMNMSWILGYWTGLNEAFSYNDRGTVGENSDVDNIVSAVIEDCKKHPYQPLFQAVLNVYSATMANY